MQGIVSLLPPDYSSQVKALWDELYTEFGLQGVQITHYAQFSWQIVQEYDFQQLDPILEEIARRTSPLKVRTAGIYLLTGPRPVIAIGIVKTIPLIKLQEELWNRLTEIATDPSPLYHPQAWLPHIPLAFEDVTQENLSAIIGKLGFRPLAWEMTIDNLSVLSQEPGNASELSLQYPLNGEIVDREESQTAS